MEGFNSVRSRLQSLINPEPPIVNVGSPIVNNTITNTPPDLSGIVSILNEIPTAIGGLEIPEFS